MNEIEAQYSHSKAGTSLFNLCAKATKLLIKHKWLYYLLACTWGIIMTLLGLIITVVLGIAKLFKANITFKKYGFIYGIKVGPDYWGGFDTGLMYIRDQKSADGLDAHEFGHTFQNCILGPLFPFIVAIPSACRWWARTLFPKKNWKAYVSAWFEDAASQCGRYAIKSIKK